MTDTAAIFARLTQRAAPIAVAYLAALRVDPARRWRDARLLWPTFTKG